MGKSKKPSRATIISNPSSLSEFLPIRNQKIYFRSIMATNNGSILNLKSLAWRKLMPRSMRVFAFVIRRTWAFLDSITAKCSAVQ